MMLIFLRQRGKEEQEREVSIPVENVFLSLPKGES